MRPFGIAFKFELITSCRQTRLLALVTDTQPVAPTVTIATNGFFAISPAPTLTVPATNPIFTTITAVPGSSGQFTLGMAADGLLLPGTYSVTLTGVTMGAARGPQGTTIFVSTPNGSLPCCFFCSR